MNANNQNFGKCINCDGEHGTFSMQCPRRREVLRELRTSDRVMGSSQGGGGTGVTSYAAAVSKVPPSIAPSLSPLSNHQDILRIFSCIIIASLKANDSGSSYNKQLNDLLALNGLPAVSVGDMTPPKVLTENSVGNCESVDVPRPSTSSGPEVGASPSQTGVPDVSNVSAHNDGSTDVMSRGSTIPPNNYSVYINSDSCQIRNISQLFSENTKGNVLFTSCDGVKMCVKDVNLLRKCSYSKIKPYFVPLDDVAFKKLVKSCSRTLRSQK